MVSQLELVVVMMYFCLQVNADIRYYTVSSNGRKQLTRVNTTHVGQNISTKAVGSSVVNIITNQYKFREGSTSERAAMLGESSGQLIHYFPPLSQLRQTRRGSWMLSLLSTKTFLLVNGSRWLSRLPTRRMRVRDIVLVFVVAPCCILASLDK